MTESSPSPKEALDAEIRRLTEAGDLEGAATMALEGYGRELLGFLIAILRSEQAASDVFSQLSEDLWRGLPSFQWRCTSRTWLYTLARHAAVRFRRRPHNQRRRHVPLSQIGEVAERVWTRTLPHLRTDMKDQLAEIRASLDPDDQALLILRVNRRLRWQEVARVMEGTDELDPASLKRVTARLRKRFQLVKEQIRDLAREQGLLQAGSKDV